MDILTRADAFAIGRRAVVTSPGLRINPKVVDVEGSDLNILLNAMALMVEEQNSNYINCLRGLFVETAEGAALDRVASDRYQLTRLPAAPATVTLTLSRPTSGFGSVTVQTGTRVQTADGTQFATDTDVVFGALELSKTVTASALVAGPEGNVPASTITQFVDPPADTTITVSNPSSGTPGLSDYVPGGAAGGVDTESDTEYRSRVLAFFPTIRRGTLGAIEFGARQVPGVAVAKAIEIVNTLVGGETIPAAAIQVIVADKAGSFSSPMLQSVRDTLLQYRAAGIPVTVTGGVVVNQFVTWDLAYQAGVNQQRAQDEVRAVTSAAAQFLKPGDTLYTATLIAAAKTVPGVIVSANSLVLPVGDTVPTSTTQLLRIPSENVSFV